MIGTKLISESVVNRQAFLPAAKQVLGFDPAKKTDALKFKSVQAEDIAMLNEFSVNQTGSSVVHLGFMFAGIREEIDDIVEIAALPHVTADTQSPLSRAVVVTGSVLQWGLLVTHNCSERQPLHIRKVFTDVYHLMCVRGLKSVFEGFRRQDKTDGTVLLLASKR